MILLGLGALFFETFRDGVDELVGVVEAMAIRTQGVAQGENVDMHNRSEISLC
jgi:hypothetical protein